MVTQIIMKQLANVSGVMCHDHCEIFCIVLLPLRNWKIDDS